MTGEDGAHTATTFQDTAAAATAAVVGGGDGWYGRGVFGSSTVLVTVFQRKALYKR